MIDWMIENINLQTVLFLIKHHLWVSEKWDLKSFRIINTESIQNKVDSRIIP